jgi:hypothetical protein
MHRAGSTLAGTVDSKQPGDAAALRHLDGIPVPELRLSAGAEFVVAICGDIMARAGPAESAGRRRAGGDGGKGH